MGSSAGLALSPSLIERQSLSDQVRVLLLEQLTSGTLRPGDRINEAEVARALGISRNPVREAISGLAQRGYLVAVTGRGHFLRRFSPEDLDDVFSFRICVETFALRQAIPRLTETDIAGLRGILAEMLAAARQSRVAELHRTDMLLHRRLCELSGNRQTLRAHAGIDTELQMLIASVELEREAPMETALAHVPIVDAIAARDADRAIAATRHHLETTWTNVMTLYRRMGATEGVQGTRA